MLLRYIAAGLLGSALLASGAFAEDQASQASYQGNWRVSKVVGLNVYNDNKETIGSINDLLMDQSGNIKAAVIGVGGFLGVGSRLVAVPFEKMKFSTEPVTYTGASNAPGAGSPPSSTTTTGSAGGSTNSQPSAMSKPNPWYPDHAVFNATKDDLQKMPEFKFSKE